MLLIDEVVYYKSFCRFVGQLPADVAVLPNPVPESIMTKKIPDNVLSG